MVMLNKTLGEKSLAWLGDAGFCEISFISVVLIGMALLFLLFMLGTNTVKLSDFNFFF